MQIVVGVNTDVNVALLGTLHEEAGLERAVRLEHEDPVGAGDLRTVSDMLAHGIVSNGVERLSLQ